MNEDEVVDIPGWHCESAFLQELQLVPSDIEVVKRPRAVGEDRERAISQGLKVREGHLGWFLAVALLNLNEHGRPKPTQQPARPFEHSLFMPLDVTLDEVEPGRAG